MNYYVLSIVIKHAAMVSTVVLLAHSGPQLAVTAAADFVEFCWPAHAASTWDRSPTQMFTAARALTQPLRNIYCRRAGPWGPRGSPRRATKLPALRVFLEHDYFPRNFSCREFHSGFGGFAEGSVLAPRCLPSAGLFVLPFYRLFLRTGTVNVLVQCPLSRKSENSNEEKNRQLDIFRITIIF